MDTQQHEILRTIYELEAEILDAGNKDRILDLQHNEEQIWNHAHRLFPKIKRSELEHTLLTLWKNANLISWCDDAKELSEDAQADPTIPVSGKENQSNLGYMPKGELEFSTAHNRDIDITPKENRYYRSRIAEVIRMLGFNRQRFDLSPSTTSFSYKLQKRLRPKRDVEIADVISELQSIPGTSDTRKRAIELALEGLHPIVHGRIAQFQLDTTISALTPAKNSRPIGIVAGVSSGKTIGFSLPAIILAVEKSLMNRGGFVRGLFVYPRSTLVEDQYQRIEEWTNNINRIANKQILQGPAIDAAGKLPAMLGNHKMSLIPALQAGFGTPGSRFEIVLTTTETLRRRIQNPYAAQAYIEDLEILVLDEAHLLDGLQGSHNSLLFQRIENARRLLGKEPIKLRMVASATMAEPDDHISKLLNCERKDVLVISPEAASEEIFGTFHHLLIRTGQGLPLLSAITNGASCLVHNRANGLVREYYDHNQITNTSVYPDPGEHTYQETKQIKKTIGFVDSLSTIGSWSFTLRDNENCIADKYHMGKFDESKWRNYPYFTWFHEPLWKLPAHHGFARLASQLRPICINCKAGIRVKADPDLLNENQDYLNAIAKIQKDRKLPFDPVDPEALGSLDNCTYFKEGMCWWFSQDDEHRIEWIPKNLYGDSAEEKKHFDEDTKKYLTFAGQLRPMQITSNVGLDDDELLNDVNDLFRQPAHHVFQVRSASFKRRLKGEFGGDAPRSQNPWRENFSLLLASPKIEVGVDFNNVQDGILFRAIRNVASYQQKAGRVGREGNSDSLIATFMTQSPTDFHYYRNPVKLSAPGHLDAVPLKIDNRDVIRCHLFLSCFDFVAMRGHELMIVRGPKQLTQEGNPDAVDFDQTVRCLADEFAGLREDLKKHLTVLIKKFKDIDVEPAINRFHELLQILNFPADQLNESLSSTWTFASLIQRRRHIAAGGRIHEIATHVMDLRGHLRECERNYIEELHKEFPISTFRELEGSVIEGRIEDFETKLPEIVAIHRKVSEKLSDLEVTEKDRKYFTPAQSFIFVANQIGKKLAEFGDKRNIIFYFLTIADEYDTLISSATQAGTLPRDLYYLDNILNRLSYFIRSYPYVMPQNFFEHPKSERVRVKFKETSSRVENVARPVALFDLLPGCWTYRYGESLKSPSGKIECQSSQGPAQIDLNSAEASGFRTRSLTLPIESKKLPEDFPPHLRSVGDYIELRAPDEVELIKAYDQVRVDKSTTLVKDGDEFEGQDLVDGTDEKDEWTRTQTIPRTSIRSWYDVRYEQSTLATVDTYNLHPITDKMFSDVSFTNELRVTQFCYGLTRSYGTAIIPPPMFYTISGKPICLGDQMITDGIVFKLDPKIVESTLQDSISPDSDCWGALFRKSLTGFLARNCDASMFTARRIRVILISIVVEDLGRFSFSLQEFKKTVKAISESQFEQRFRQCELIRFHGKSEQIRSAKDRLDRYWDDTLVAFKSFKKLLGEFNQAFIESWNKDIFVHSIALKAYQAAILCSGAGSGEMGYFYNVDAEDNHQFYLFDKVEGGNGLAEIIRNHFYISGQKRADENSLPTTDFVSEFLFRMGACPSHLTLTACSQSRKIVDTPKLGTSVKELLTSDIEYSLETLGTNRIVWWLVKKSKVQFRPNYLDELQFAIDSACILLEHLIEDGILPGGTPYDDFERALAGCIDACPECLDDQENSVFGTFLNKEHVDNRLIGKVLNQIINQCDNPSVKRGKSEPEIASLKMGADDGEIKSLKKDWPTEIMITKEPDSLSFERIFLFDPQ